MLVSMGFPLGPAAAAAEAVGCGVEAATQLLLEQQRLGAWNLDEGSMGVEDATE